MVVKTIFNLLKSKLKKGMAEEDKEKGRKNIELRVRKSSFKRFGANTIINFVAKACNCNRDKCTTRF